jgi:hypothetical protein
MDEIVLVKECLSDSKLKTGKDLLEKLDASGISIEAAYWVYSYETNDWRLHIVTPEIDRRGWEKGFASLQKVTRKFPVSFRFDVSVHGLKNRFYQHMLELRRDRAFSNVELDRLPVGGDLVDLYIYRLPAPRKKGSNHA